jgi:hypothetical protein
MLVHRLSEAVEHESTSAPQRGTGLCGLQTRAWGQVLSARNVFGRQQIAFAAPGLDGNVFQPAPTRRIAFALRDWLGGC